MWELTREVSLYTLGSLNASSPCRRLEHQLKIASMAFILRKYECPDCGGVFTHLHESTNGVEDPPPSFCAKCGNYMGVEPQSVPGFGAIRTAKNQSIDNVYRMSERMSEQRAEAAADMAGVPKSEMSHLKVTDMKDNMRQGDIAAVTPPPRAAPPPGFGFAANAAEYAKTTQAGPGAGQHGLTAAQMIKQNHAVTAAVAQRSGEIGRHAQGR